jgi:hypothetical protein
MHRSLYVTHSLLTEGLHTIKNTDSGAHSPAWENFKKHPPCRWKIQDLLPSPGKLENISIVGELQNISVTQAANWWQKLAADLSLIVFKPDLHILCLLYLLGRCDPKLKIRNIFVSQAKEPT